MLWSLWLWDVLHSIHSNLSLNFSSGEVLTNLPGSTVSFKQAYKEMLQETDVDDSSWLKSNSIPSRDLVFLMLLAILSDSITLNRSLGSEANLINPASLKFYKQNPYAPFAAHSEMEQTQDRLSKALDRWHARFGTSVAAETIAFYLYCKLYQSCHELQKLVLLSKLDASAFSSAQVSISDESVTHAWAILDASAACPKTSGSLTAAWMPIVVFHAALIVWGHTNRDKTESRRGGHGSLRALLVFKLELEAMKWPCCVDMAATIQRLIS
jgi:hypothetical protein